MQYTILNTSSFVYWLDQVKSKVYSILKDYSIVKDSNADLTVGN